MSESPESPPGEARRRLELLLDRVPDVVISAELSGRLAYVNAAGRALLDGSSGGVGAMLEEALSGTLGGGFLARVRSAVAADGEGEFEWRGTGDPQPWFEVRASRTPDRLYLYLRDITHRKAEEAALRASESRLLQAQKMEAVGRLASGVAHDFNNILTAVRGNVELVLMDLPDDSTAREDLQEILQVASRGSELTGQLLSFTRKRVAAPRRIDVNAVIREIEGMTRRTIGEDVDLVFDLDPSVGAVRIDPGQIQQVVMNLLVNARDAMPKGGRITVATENVVLSDAYGAALPDHVRPGPFVLLTVTDEGAGMDAETLSRAFEPYFTTKERGKGTGLGLSTVYGIVAQAGGHIWPYSEPARGSAFKVYLPRMAGDPEAVGAAEDEAPPAAIDARIVVVEDDQAVRSTMVRTLERHGYAVYCAGDPAEAMESFGADAAVVDLILTDVVMPGSSGVELVAELRRRGFTGSVIYISGYGRSATGDRGDDIFHLPKPFSGTEMLHQVGRALSRVRDQETERI